MDLGRLIGIARTWIALLAACTVVGGAAAFALASTQPRAYESSAILVVGQSLSGLNPDYTQLLASQRLSATYASVATTRSILENTIDQLDLDQTPEQLSQAVRATAPPDNSLLIITARSKSPDVAASIANSVAQQLIAKSPSLQGPQADLQRAVQDDLEATQRQMATIEAQIDRIGSLESPSPSDLADSTTLQSQLVSLRSSYAALLSFMSNASNLLTLIQPAVAGTTPVGLSPALTGLLGALVGLSLAVLFVLTREYLDDTIKDREAVTANLGLSTLSTIVRMPTDREHRELYRLAALLYPKSLAAEAFRTLRTSVEFASIDRPVRKILVTSAIPGEGKTMVAANLAIVFAQAGRRVVLVDCDLRRPGVDRIFELHNEAGVSSLLRDASLEVEAVTQHVDQDGLRVVTSGPLPPNQAEWIASDRMRALIDRMAEGNEVVVVDSPPLDAVSDAAVLSTYVDGVLLVVDSGRTRRAAIRHGLESLAQANARVLGVVLNRVPEEWAAQYPYYLADSDGSRTSDVPATSATRPAHASGRTASAVSGNARGARVRSATADPKS